MGLLGKYTDAYELFEKVAQACANDKLRKFGARGHLLNAVICLLATGDNVAVRRALDNCSSIYFKWADSWEAKFLSSLASAAERLDGSAFAAIVQDYDSLLDEWKTAVLVKAREKIVENEHVELAV
jgi:alpha-soluble NSF attachment protein